MGLTVFSNEIKMSWLKYNQVNYGDRVQKRFSLGHHIDCLKRHRKPSKCWACMSQSRWCLHRYGHRWYRPSLTFMILTRRSFITIISKWDVFIHQMSYYTSPLNKQWLVCSNDATSREVGTLGSRENRAGERPVVCQHFLAILWCSDALMGSNRKGEKADTSVQGWYLTALAAFRPLLLNLQIVFGRWASLARMASSASFSELASHVISQSSQGT